MNALITLAIAAALGLSACEKKQDVPVSPQQVSVIIAKISKEPVFTELPGRLEAYRQAEIRARVAGIVTAKLYQEGQNVKAGTALFRIDSSLMKAAYDVTAGKVESARAMHLAAADKLNRYKDLKEDRAVSELEYAAAVAEEGQSKATLTSAEATQKNARLSLDYANVTSPIEGRARRAMVTEGALVGLDSPTPLTIVEQIDPIFVNFAQPAGEVIAMRRATKNGTLEKISEEKIDVEIKMADGTIYGEKGKLLFSDLAVDPKTDTVSMRAVFPNKNGELLPGSFVSVKLARAVNNTAFLIPRDALLRGANTATVMIVNADQKVESLIVKAEELRGTSWVVTEGLKGGEQIILSNPGMMVPGTVVKPIPKESDASVAPKENEDKSPANQES